MRHPVCLGERRVSCRHRDGVTSSRFGATVFYWRLALSLDSPYTWSMSPSWCALWNSGQIWAVCTESLYDEQSPSQSRGWHCATSTNHVGELLVLRARQSSASRELTGREISVFVVAPVEIDLRIYLILPRRTVQTKLASPSLTGVLRVFCVASSRFGATVLYGDRSTVKLLRTSGQCPVEVQRPSAHSCTQGKSELCVQITDTTTDYCRCREASHAQTSEVIIVAGPESVRGSILSSLGMQRCGSGGGVTIVRRKCFCSHFFAISHFRAIVRYGDPSRARACAETPPGQVRVILSSCLTRAI